MQFLTRAGEEPHLKSSTEEHFYTAKLGKTVGVGGALVVHSFSGEYSHFKQLTSILLRLPSENEPKRFIVLRWEWVHGKFAVVIKGYEDKETAATLTHALVLVTRDSAAELREDEVYIQDILGTPVYLMNKRFGILEAVYDLGVHDCLEVKKESGEMVMIPLLEVFVRSVDVRCIELQNHELFHEDNSSMPIS